MGCSQGGVAEPVHEASLMKIAYFSTQMPYPPNHGGRVDDWRRLCALKTAGARIHLVTWCSDRPGERPDPGHLEALYAVAEVVHVWPIRRTLDERLMRLMRLTRWPSHVASRMLSRQQWSVLRQSLEAFAPDVVWQDGLYSYTTAHRAAQAMGVPRFYRSHNIEHVYMARQVAKATSWRDKLAWGLNLPHLRRVEHAAVAGAAAYFDISTDDLAYWSGLGLKRGYWLPPLVDPVFAGRLSEPRETPPRFDVAYLGNLHAPNNVEGVLWFAREVMPRLRAHRPEIRVMVAGSQPTVVIRETLSRTPGVTLVENAPDVVSVLRDARVLVNPIFVGSGVNVKSVEMLFAPAHLVSTPQGVAGLPPHVQACFALAQTANAFAEAVLAKIDTLEPHADTLRVAARAEFGFERVQQMLEVMGRVTSVEAVA